MLVQVLTVELNNLVTQRKHEDTRGKGNKEPGNDQALPVSRMLWNYLEDSREIYNPSDGWKSRSRLRIGSRLGPKGWSQKFTH